MNGFFPEGWNTQVTDSKKAFTPAFLAEAQAKQTVLESTALMCDAAHNLIIDLGQIKGIIPREEGAIGIADGSTRDIALISRVGKPVCFAVTAIGNDENGRPCAVLSRRKAQQLCREYILTQKSEGDIINAKITHMESFGAFCDIGCGNIALLPIDAISVSRISHPRDRFFIGQNIRVIIKNIAPDGKITLSHKELLGTWAENAALFSPGQTVTGVVRSVEDYGIFVELTPNLAGLAEPRENVRVGQAASVYIKALIPEKMKVKLIIVDVFENSVFPSKINYFITSGRLTKWVYSTNECYKNICSEFV